MHLRDHCTFQTDLFVLGHEISHDLVIRLVLTEVDVVEVTLKDLNSALEEAKADMLGV